MGRLRMDVSHVIGAKRSSRLVRITESASAAGAHMELSGRAGLQIKIEARPRVGEPELGAPVRCRHGLGRTFWDAYASPHLTGFDYEQPQEPVGCTGSKPSTG